MTPSPVRRLLGTALGLGWLPKAPGTWGSLGTVLVVAALVGVQDVVPGLLGGEALGGAGAPGTGPVESVDLASSLLPALVALAATFWLGIWLGNRANEDFGRHDPGEFVLDEVLGQGLALLPLLPGPLSPGGMLVAFAAFRLFDIAKPFPVRQVEAWPGGLGIMADDVMAGLYALGVVVLFGLWVGV